MKVVVIGATGTIGRLAVEQMLEVGHEVTAFARNPSSLDLVHENLTLAPGNARDLTAVKLAVAGQDAVVVTLGSGKSLTSRIRSEGTMAVIQAMQAEGIHRLIVQSTLGAHESWPNLNFWWKRVMFGGILKKVFKDHELQEQLVRASGLDWTIVRPGAFSDAPLGGEYREAFGPEQRKLKLTIGRADIAAFLKRQLTETTYLRRAVAISA